MSHFNALAEQMGVGDSDDDRNDPFGPNPEPFDDGSCRECGYPGCDGGCVLTDAQKNALLDAADAAHARRLLTSPFRLDAGEVQP